MRSWSARSTGSGERKSMSATQRGSTSAGYLCHLLLSVTRRSMTRSKSWITRDRSFPSLQLSVQRPSRRTAPPGRAGPSFCQCDGAALAAGFEEAGGPLSAADAHRHDAVAGLPPEHLVGDGADHARARHAERVTDGDRPAVRVQLLHGDAEL